MALLPDDGSRAGPCALRGLAPHEPSAGVLAIVEHTIARVGAGALGAAFGPDIGTAELVHIEPSQSMTRGHTVISARVRAVHNRDQAREQLRATGMTHVQLAITIDGDTPPEAGVLATFEVAAHLDFSRPALLDRRP